MIYFRLIKTLVINPEIPSVFFTVGTFAYAIEEILLGMFKKALRTFIEVPEAI